MTDHTLFLSAVIVAALLAIANVTYAAVLIRSGEKTRATKFMMFGAAMLMLMVAALFSRQS